jgi:hypothetical protein
MASEVKLPEVNVKGLSTGDYACSINSGKVVVSYNSDNEFSVGYIVIDRRVYEEIIDYLIKTKYIEDREDFSIPREVMAEVCITFPSIKYNAFKD